jgi:hypothetical protein
MEERTILINERMNEETTQLQRRRKGDIKQGRKTKTNGRKVKGKKGIIRKEKIKEQYIEI